MALSSKRMQAGSARSAEHALFRRCAGGDGAARDELILLYMPLAHRLARRYWFKREPLDDLLQVALDDMTQFEIASEMGISQMHVSRLIRRALARLREITGSDEAA